MLNVTVLSAKFSGLPIKKCLGDKDVWLKGSLDKAHMGLEF
jgi:hypothetical protein